MVGFEEKNCHWCGNNTFSINERIVGFKSDIIETYIRCLKCNCVERRFERRKDAEYETSHL